MGKIIEFKNTNFGYDNTNTFNDFNMEINAGDIVTLVGTSGSGKTTLLSMLCNKLPNDTLFYRENNIKSCDIKELQKELVVVFDTPLLTDTIDNELSYYLKKLALDNSEIISRVDNFKSAFDLSRFANTQFKQLSHSDACLIKILRYLIIEPDFLAIDNVLTGVQEADKKKIIDYIKSKNITLLNVTTNLKDSLYGNKIFVLENFVLILEGNTMSVLKMDTLLKRLGFKLPFTVDLSIELNHYDLTKKIYTDKKKLVDELWK